ncbi:hypothetical protein C4K68_17950 [Pokkaliibacter plantistimulans]|uniref:FAD-binding FR-type domain-containing protein n=1 Tax=Proteobacteria bacterium 228 TaxID=2083153 RepID=A0A2S5KN35_9PROT|nr:FAD-binding oxidoreductase [Pokkaliibacter plantistimulans]PPC75939.1 hypothetical protein C4K68_17950 [Pokkaliibacter plantistimulans]
MSSPITINLVARETLSEHTLKLVFQRADNEPIVYEPGQFFSLHIPTATGQVTRSYSVATLTDNIHANMELEVAVTCLDKGQASNYFAHAPLGAELTMTGPFGALTLPEQLPSRLLLIGTGTGVAPYRSMLPLLSRRMKVQPDTQVILLMGVRQPEELLYGDDFIHFAKRQQNFQLLACYSRLPVDAHLHDFERQGRLLQHLHELEPTAEQDLVYICGHPAMVDDVWTYMKQRHFSVRQVKREKYLLSAATPSAGG